MEDYVVRVVNCRFLDNSLQDFLELCLSRRLAFAASQSTCDLIDQRQELLGGDAVELVFEFEIDLTIFKVVDPQTANAKDNPSVELVTISDAEQKVGECQVQVLPDVSLDFFILLFV